MFKKPQPLPDHAAVADNFEAAIYAGVCFFPFFLCLGGFP
jgi:hypothetical protein